MQILQRRILHLVDALDLPHQQLRVANEFQRLRTMLDCIFQSSNQPLILREVVGLMAQVLAERGDLLSGFILYNDAKPGRAGVPARSSVTVRNQEVRWRILALVEKE